MSRKKLETAKDGRQYIDVTDLITSLAGQSVKLYILSSADSHYYQVDITAGPTLDMDDVGTTPPTDGLIIIGG